MKSLYTESDLLIKLTLYEKCLDIAVLEHYHCLFDAS